MKKKEFEKLTTKEKVIKGLEIAYQKMIEEKRRNKQEIVITKGDKIITFIP